ncbi:MAG: sugar transferase [Lachnospiraceae bacterium]|nr:sugar transferase [Lachnospiraceae bacterium]
MYQKYVKRVLDILLSALMLVLLSPVLLVTALLVRVKLGSPVVFKQPRPGMHEKIFQLCKFRSMTNETGEDGRLLPDAKRLTRFGRFLRSSSLDELLELVNILKGDMSFVGPRPLSIFYLPHYPEEFRRRHDVRPGLTGLAQVNGRNNLPWDERFTMDIEYVDHVSFGMDLKILFRTALKVVKRADVSVRGTTKVKDFGPYSILKMEEDGGVQVAGMTYSEIGSYFWTDGQSAGEEKKEIDWLPASEDSCFTFSGRNAIDIVLRDILKKQPVKRVYMPSYCCVSMLQAFADRGIRVDFYEVGLENGRFIYRLPETEAGSVVLVMSYFGLSTAEAHKAVSALHDKGAVVIEDITHSLLTKEPASKDSDYLVASLRKWFAAPAGGWAGKKAGTFSEKPYLDSNHAVEEKRAAMEEKYAYLTGKISSKEHFLLQQAKFDNDLIHVDRMLRIDDESLRVIAGTDTDEVIRRRRENAKILREGLSSYTDVLSFPEMDLSEDTPLFVPVFMETEARDALRQYLIGKGIYCPVHWPEVMGAEPGLRKHELSLICDQRYGTGDMQAIVQAVTEWRGQYARGKAE